MLNYTTFILKVVCEIGKPLFLHCSIVKSIRNDFSKEQVKSLIRSFEIWSVTNAISSRCFRLRPKSFFIFLLLFKSWPAKVSPTLCPFLFEKPPRPTSSHSDIVWIFWQISASLPLAKRVLNDVIRFHCCPARSLA